MITYKTDSSNIDWEAMRQTLIEDHFDNGRTPEQYRISFANSYAFVIALDGDRIVGTARMLSDGVCSAYIVDVWTLSVYRRRGIARTMMQSLESKAPGQHISLWTGTAHALYDSLGYSRSKDTLYEKVAGVWLQNTPR